MNTREDYYYSLILLFVPFRDEASLVQDDETAEEGYRVDKNGLHPMPEKVAAIVEAPEPQPQIYKPIFHLNPTVECFAGKRGSLEAFQMLKEKLASSEVLAYYDPKLPLLLDCDASAYGVGAVLSHRFPDGSERPIAYASRTLTPAKRNMPR